MTPPKGKGRSGGDPAPAPADLTYEQAMTEAESLIDRIESGDLGLEQSLAAYERGRTLLDRCDEILNRVEQRVTELTPARPANAQDHDGDTDDAEPQDTDD